MRAAGGEDLDIFHAVKRTAFGDLLVRLSERHSKRNSLAGHVISTVLARVAQSPVSIPGADLLLTLHALILCFGVRRCSNLRIHRSTIFPGQGNFQLACQPKQGRLIPKTTKKLNANRQTIT